MDKNKELDNSIFVKKPFFLLNLKGYSLSHQIFYCLKVKSAEDNEFILNRFTLSL